MASNTFTKIASVTVGSGGASSIDFSSIPATYTDICLELSLLSDYVSSSASEYFSIYFNSSNANLTYRRLYGAGSSAGSDNGASGLIGGVPSNGWTANTFSSATIYIPNYTSSNYKSFGADNVAENNSATVNGLDLTAGLWSSTAAITEITLIPRRSNFAQYSTATLYGIKNS